MKAQKRLAQLPFQNDYCFCYLKGYLRRKTLLNFFWYTFKLFLDNFFQYTFFGQLFLIHLNCCVFRPAFGCCMHPKLVKLLFSAVFKIKMPIKYLVTYCSREGVIIECPLNGQYHDRRDVILTSRMAVSNSSVSL